MTAVVLFEMEKKLNLGSGGHPLDGFTNLDKEQGWTFESGLPDYADNSVDAITISHALMYVKEEDYPAVMAELFRVLKPEGVLRVTEDDTRFWKWHTLVSLTTPDLLARTMLGAGFAVAHVESSVTQWRDRSLIQDFHPRATSFWIEGVKL